MSKYKYIVTITTDTEEHAQQVISERVFFDEEYTDKNGVEFDYKINYEELGVLHDKEIVEQNQAAR